VKIISNAGAEAGQIIFHTHFHIIPRFTKDGSMDSASSMVDSTEASETLAAVKACL
jgi:histidine triad (HIT) family protein